MRATTQFLILILCAALLFALLVARDMSERGVWCARTPAQIAHQCRALVAVAEALNAANATHWLCYGSALAATRGAAEGVHPWPIPWESDDDLCVFAEESSRVEKALLAIAQGPEQLATEVLVGNVVRYRVTRKDRAAGEEWKIDVYAHVRRMFFGDLEMIQNIAPNRDHARRDFPANLLEPLQRHSMFCGSDAFALPRDDQAYAAHVFGSTWRTPIASFTGSNGYRRLTCLLSSKWISMFGGGHIQDANSLAAAGASIGPKLRIKPQQPPRREDT
eukprot:g4457.t1